MAKDLVAAELGRVCQALENAGEHEDTTEAKALWLLLTEQVERSYALTRLAAEGPSRALEGS